MNDLKYACRQLLKNPGFTAVAVLTLALAIRANTAIFTLVNSVLLRTLPGVKHPHQLVRVTDRGGDSLPYALYDRLRNASRSFSGLAAAAWPDQRRMRVTRSGAFEAKPVWVQAVSGNFFSVLGVPTPLGRTLTPDDDRLGNPLTVAGGLRQIVRELDPKAEVTDLRTMDDFVNSQLHRERTLSHLVGFFSVSALVLACPGLYGILSYAVVRRTREIGVRMALGAQTTDVLSLVIRQGMTLTLMGCALGVALATALTRLVSSQLYGVTATDPLTFAFTTGLVGAVVLVACWIPARRAAKVDPMVALRHE